MEVIEYFAEENKSHWKNQIALSDWRAAKFLLKLLDDIPKMNELLGENGKLFLLINETEIVSFATLTYQDCVIDPDMFPWIGFVYTYPQYRGNRYSQKLLNTIEIQARKDGYNKVHIATDHVGLYEKFDYTFLKTCIDSGNEEARVYYKML